MALSLLIPVAGLSALAGPATAATGSPNSAVVGGTTFSAYVGAGESLNTTFTKANGGSSDTQFRITDPSGTVVSTCTILASAAIGTDTCNQPGLTGPEGVWTIEVNALNGQPANWPESGSTLYHWVISVQNAGADVPGRVWTEKYRGYDAPSSPGGGYPVNFWVLTEHGSHYKVELNSFRGGGWAFDSTALGITEPGTCTPLYRSINLATNTPEYPPAPDSCGDPYKLFFEPPAADLPATAITPSGTDWVNPPVTTPEIANLQFATDGGGTRAGTFSYDLIGFTGSYSLQIDVNGDGEFDGPEDRVITLGGTSGPQSHAWDGLDGAGNVVDACQPVNARVQIDRTDEIHFVLGDVEGLGGVTINQLVGNAPGQSVIYWDDREIGARTTTTPVVDGREGFDSDVPGGVHGWPNGANPWGNQSAIDNWTYSPVDINATIAVDTSCLEIEKTSTATADTRAGDTVTYTVTATNSGTGNFTAADPARVWDDLSGVLDDATYNHDAAADRDPTAPSFVAGMLMWEGALPAGESVTITYTVTLRGGGDGVVRNVAFAQCDSADPDCDPVVPACDPPVGGVDPDTGKVCAEVVHELPTLTVVKVADRTDLPAVGETVTYTVTVTNQGPGDYTATAPATMTDDLSDVLDDTTDPTNITASVGTASFTTPSLTWTGVLAAGESATIAYDVTYTGGGDAQLTNNACVPVAEAQDPQDPCAVVQIPGSGLDQAKVSDPATGTSVEPGEEITYTLRFTNTGPAGATVDTFDDLSGVLDDAALDVGSLTADAGLTATFDGGNQRIDISGTVPVGGSLEVTYTVRVLAWADQGDHVLRNALQCQPGDPQPCDPEITEHPVRAIDIEKTSDRTATTQVGDTVTYTITAQNIGEADYTVDDPALVRDTLAGVLDDGTYNNDATANPAGNLVYLPPVIRWEGALATDEVVTISYTVTLESGGDYNVRNVAWGGPGPAPECDPPTAEGVDPVTGQPCDSVAFLLPDLRDSKSVDPTDRTTVLAGEELTYTLTFENVGQGAGEVNRDDSLAMLLDDAEIVSGPDSSDPALTATLTGELIEIRGTLGAGDLVTVSYTVRVKSDAERLADGADSMIGNFLIDPGTPPPTQCLPVADEDSTCNPVPLIVDSKSVDPSKGSKVASGQTLNYTLTFSNVGTAPGAVDKVDDLTQVLDDARVIAGPVSSDAALVVSTVSGGTFTITGTLAAGQTVVVSYAVQVKKPKGLGDRMLGNYLLEPGTPPPSPEECLAQMDEDSTCNPLGRFDLALDKSVVGGTKVMVGDTVRYRLRVSNRGPDAAPGPIRVTDRLPKGLTLRSARGRGWDCKVNKAKATCVRSKGLGPDRKAPPVTVVAKATRAALGGRVVNQATVRAAGDIKRSNNRGKARIRVVRVPPLPSTGFRPGTWGRI